MKLLIIGRSGVGKDSVREILEKEYGMTFVKSRTTRPRRTPGEDTHEFVTQARADSEASVKVARTVINGYEYYATEEQVNASDGYIIDPEGAYGLLKNMPSEKFIVVYIESGDEKAREAMAAARASDPEKELGIFKERCASEDRQFSEFEKRDFLCNEFPNCVAVIRECNTFAEGFLEVIAGDIADAGALIK